MKELPDPALVPDSAEGRAPGSDHRSRWAPLWAIGATVVVTFAITGLSLFLTDTLQSREAADRPDVVGLLLWLAVLFLIPVISGIVLGYRWSARLVLAGYAGIALASVAFAAVGASPIDNYDPARDLSAVALGPAIFYFPAVALGALIGIGSGRRSCPLEWWFLSVPS